MSSLIQTRQKGSVLLRLLAYFLVAAAYFLIGCMFSAPYTFLAGWHFDHFYLSAWLMPLTLTFLFVFWKVMRRQQHKWGGFVFWIIVAYLSSPIILNGASVLLKLMGHETVSCYIFAGRYFSLWAIPVFLIVGMIIFEEISILRQRFSRNVAPPPNL